MVCNRKHWGGNKTRAGAWSTSVLGSVCRTADQQHLDPGDVLYLIATTDGAAHGLDLSVTRRSRECVPLARRSPSLLPWLPLS